MKPKHFLFLTTANFATNPRLVKEIKEALQIGINVTVQTFKLGNWSDQKSEQIHNELKLLGNVEILQINATNSDKLSYIFWGGLEKTFRRFYSFFRKNVHFIALANTRRSIQLVKAGMSLKIKPDLICAHNLGTLYPAYILSKKWKCPFNFDVEDYHPGEKINTDIENEKKRRKFLMKTLLPKAEAITSASPAIEEYTLNLIGGHKNHQVILNGFPQNEFKKPNEEISQNVAESEILKLVWFSQKIGAGRGLEQLFEALLQIELYVGQTIELTLIGEMDKNFKRKVINPFENKISHQHILLHQIPPLAQSELHKKLSRFDVGLALEFDTTDLNRQLCLTNKILAYAQAGLFVVATDTKAQKDFISKHPELGIIAGQSINDLKEAIEHLFNSFPEIKQGALRRYKESTALSWEKEARKLNKIWNSI